MINRCKQSWLSVAGLCVVVQLTVSLPRARAEVQTKTIIYEHNSQKFHGFVAWDDATSDRRPGVLVVHEWWGLNDYARERAKQLAALGFVAFAADMYGDGKTVEHPKEAGEMATKVRANVAEWRARAAEALNVLRAQPSCDGERIAVIGYCFGGSTALQLAYSGADIDAVATFHAALPTPTADEAKQIKARVLINHGADDPFIPQAAINSFRQAFDQAQVGYEFVAYPGARHSFTVRSADAVGNPGMKYDEAADRQSWDKLQTLLKSTVAK